MSKIRYDEGKARQRTWFLVAAFFVLLALVFLSASGRLTSPLASHAVSMVISPFQVPISWVAEKLYGTRAWLWDVYAVYDQNRALRQEVTELRIQNARAREAVAENLRLHTLLGYKETMTQFDLVSARVIGRETSTWTEMIVIDRGTMQGVRESMPVVTSQGLVGVVTETTPYSAEVRLLTDPRSAVGAIVQRPESRAAGIVQGDLSDALYPRMVNLPKASDIVEDDILVTSGFGGIYPKGIHIGKVKRVTMDVGGLLKIAHLETAVDFTRLEDVAVIVASREEPPAPLAPPVQTAGTETNPEEVLRQEQEAIQKAREAAEAARKQAAEMARKNAEHDADKKGAQSTQSAAQRQVREQQQMEEQEQRHGREVDIR